MDNWKNCQGYIEVENLKDWQKAQNGSMQRIVASVDRMQYLLLGSMATMIGSMLVLLLRK